MKARHTVLGLLSAMALIGSLTTDIPTDGLQTAQAASVTYKQSATSQVGQLKTVNSRIYTAPGSKTSIAASTKYTNEIFYVLKKATAENSDTYYLVSRQLDPNKAAVGWIKASSIKLATYKQLTNTKKTRYIKGTGKAYTRPGGLARNVLLANLTSYKNKTFTNNMTVKIGTVTWYRATVNSQTLWLPASALSTTKLTTVAAPVKVKKAQLLRVKAKNSLMRTDVASVKTEKSSGNLTGKTFTSTMRATYDKVTYINLVENNAEIGWMKLSDVTANAYTVPKNISKIVYLKGTSNGYNKPWGSTKDIVVKNLASLKDQKFTVTQQAKVANSTWYYGKVADGKDIWVAASATVATDPQPETPTPIEPEKPAAPVVTAVSKLARVTATKPLIRTNLVDEKTEKVNTTLNSTTFTVTEQAVYADETYYNLVQNGQVIGWVKPADVTVNTYSAPTAVKKTVYHKGTSYGYSQPWGSTSDRIVKDTAAWKEQAFTVTKQAKVASSIWYYGAIEKGTAVWVAASATTDTPPAVAAPVYTAQSLQGVVKSTATLYMNLTTFATKILTTNEKTEKFSINRSAVVGGKTYYEVSRLSTAGKNTVVGWVLSSELTTTKVTAPVKTNAVFYLSGLGNATNIAGGTAVGNVVFKDLASYPAAKFTATSMQKIGSVTYYLGKVNGKTVWVSEANFGQPFRYFNLRKVSDITQAEMEAYLIYKKKDPIKTNNLYKAIPVFLEMQNKYGINAQFMLAHAIWETGWGGSAISQYKNNFFGYQAFDSCAMTCAMYFPSGTDGIQYYADAIYRKYLRDGAIYNNGVSPAGMNVKYATDKTWAINIARLMEEMKPYNATYYDSVRPSTVDPVQPAFNYSNVIPTGQPIPPTYHTFDSGITAKVTLTTSARKLPYATAAVVKTYAVGTTITLNGTNNDVAGSWVRVLINKEEAWVSRAALKINNLGQATTEANIRDLPTTTHTKVLATIKQNTFFKLVLDSKGAPVTKKDSQQTIWYNVQIPGKKTTGWISSTIVKIY
ncbi:MAG: SH3-like domain-containing protein [Kurthia sp.]|nr:SH3-like domain-containing protein [Candidatus Kurthia equi]